jgi:hypothetical protein
MKPRPSLLSSIVCTVLVVASLEGSTRALAQTLIPAGSGSGTVVSTPPFFNFPVLVSGAEMAGGTQRNTYSGKDNIGGAFVGETIYGIDLPNPIGPCVAPDGSAGTSFPLEPAATVRTYAKGQLFLFESSGGTHCITNKVAAGQVHYPFSETLTSVVTGGTGPFASASGSLTETFTGVSLTNNLNVMITGFGGGAFLSVGETVTGGSITK